MNKGKGKGWGFVGVPMRPEFVGVPNQFGNQSSFADDEPLDVVGFQMSGSAEPDPDCASEGCLSLTTRVEYTSLARGTPSVFGLVSIKAAESVGSQSVPERQPTDLMCVLDVSGSMQGEKIRQLQTAVRFIIDQADPRDRLSIVTFNSSASRIVPFTKMTTEGRDVANVAVLRLSSGGGTSISAGMDVAIAAMEQRRCRNRVSAILLLTDGQDHSTRPHIPALISRSTNAKCSVYAFGFGADHDAALLSEISEQARTPFTFVEDTERLEEAFAGTVSGLSSIAAQNIELKLDAHVPIKAIHTPFQVKGNTVTIPDVFAGEQKDLLVELQVPGDRDASDAVLLSASLKYLDMGLNVLVQTTPQNMSAVVVDEPQPEMEPDEEVTAHRERVEVTHVLQQAAEKGEHGEFRGAQELLASTEQRLQAKSKKTKYSHALCQELADAKNRMQSRSSWEGGGRAEVRDACQMHNIQRCTNTYSSKSSTMQKSSKSMYVTHTQARGLATTSTSMR